MRGPATAREIESRSPASVVATFGRCEFAEADRVDGLTPLEAQVIRMLLAGDGAVLAALRAQAESLVVLSRQMTGTGFFTRLRVAARDADVVSDRSFKLGDVSGSVAGVSYELGFLLWIEQGRLSMLEGFTYEEPWPTDVREFRLEYVNGRKHDLEALERLKH
jgi:hypothetical protein